MKAGVGGRWLRSFFWQCVVSPRLEPDARLMSSRDAPEGDVAATLTLLDILFTDRFRQARILGTARGTLEGRCVYVTSQGDETTETPPTSDEDADQYHPVRFTISQCRVWIQLSQVCWRAATCLQRRMVRVRHQNDAARFSYYESIAQNVDDLQEELAEGNARVAFVRHPTPRIQLTFDNPSFI